MNRTDTASRADLGDQTALGRSIAGALAREGAISVRAFDRVVAAVDASHYLLTPRAVVTPTGIDEVAALLAYANAAGEPVTFRSGGTSLSGQASTGHILVDTRKHFRSIEVLDKGERVRVGPGATVRQVNTRLARHGRKLGPDPASEIACTIGGVVANNSSGMACGTAQNTYRTLDSAVIVLASGTVLNTADADADGQLLAAEPQLWRALHTLRERLIGCPRAARRGDPAVLDQEHDGLQHQRPRRPRQRDRDPRAPHDRQRGHARLRRRSHLPHRPAAQARGNDPARLPDTAATRPTLSSASSSRARRPSN